MGKLCSMVPGSFISIGCHNSNLFQSASMSKAEARDRLDKRNSLGLKSFGCNELPAHLIKPRLLRVGGGTSLGSGLKARTEFSARSKYAAGSMLDEPNFQKGSK